MSKAKIQISVHDGNGGFSPLVRVVMAQRGPFAVTRVSEADCDERGKTGRRKHRFLVTHVHTGLRASGPLTLGNAKRMLTALPEEFLRLMGSIRLPDSPHSADALYIYLRTQPDYRKAAELFDEWRRVEGF